MQAIVPVECVIAPRSYAKPRRIMYGLHFFWYFIFCQKILKYFLNTVRTIVLVWADMLNISWRIFFH